VQKNAWLHLLLLFFRCKGVLLEVKVRVSTSCSSSFPRERVVSSNASHSTARSDPRACAHATGTNSVLHPQATSYAAHLAAANWLHIRYVTLAEW
jgi:hypothetical protein